MITLQFLIFLFVGTVAMLIPLLIYRKWNRVKWYQSLLAACALTVVGTIGTYLMGLLENQFRFGSRSFYGAVFLIPLVFPVVSRALKLRYGQLMDMSAPAVCVMLVLMKMLCALEGCCGGCVLWTNPVGREIYFPSQTVELINALILTVILMRMAHKEKYKGMVYPWYLVLYGCSRFVLNFFRAQTHPFVWIIPAGHFWSLCAVLTGGIAIIYCKKTKLAEKKLNV